MATAKKQTAPIPPRRGGPAIAAAPKAPRPRKGFEDLAKEVQATSKRKERKPRTNADKVIYDVYQDLARELKLPKRASEPLTRKYSHDEVRMLTQLLGYRVATFMLALWVVALLWR